MLSRLFGLLFHRRVFIALGLILLALLIWFAGPLFAFADWRPLAPVSVRLWIIGLIFGFVLLRMIARYWREKRLNARMVEAVLGLKSAKQAPEDPNKPALDALRADFERALTQMRDARFARPEDGLWSRLSRRYVYQMPWYVFIGAPGSGKTTALVNSGLRFPLAQSLGKESVRGVGGTRSCDWWFAEEAVLLDTAGRYTTQESNAEADRAEWQGFLSLLKRFRPRQPLNGAILTLSVSDLLSADEEERKRHAERLRARLLELTSNLGIAFPIYVLVTKADQLGGFNEYFERLSKEERAQVWGLTLDLPAQPEAGRDDLDESLRRELEQLNRRLFERLPEVLVHELDPARRARAYALPQHFAGLLPALREVLGEVFAGKRFGPAAMLRGVYFTSGTQDGSSFDRLLGSLQRSLGFDARVALPSQAQAGRSYFLQDLLHKVVLGESHLAGRNRRAERRERWLGIAGHATVGASLVLAVAALLGSYRGNLDYVAHVDSTVRAVNEHLVGLKREAQLGLQQALPVIGVFEIVADGPDFVVSEPPWRLGFGLYQGEKLDAAAQASYRRSLENVLLPQIIERARLRLEQTPESDLEGSYAALRVYLMLHQPEHFDADEVEDFMQRDFERGLPGNLPPSRRAELEHHLHRLLHEGNLNPGLVMDEALVERVRLRLAGFSTAERAYAQLKRELLPSLQREFTVLEAGGSRAARIFARRSGKPLTEGVPGLFTHHGYHNVFLPRVNSMLSMIDDEERWVLGRLAHTDKQEVDAMLAGSRQREMRELYLNEYREIWMAYLADLTVRMPDNIVETRETARLLASPPDSPLRKLLLAVMQETRLAEYEEGAKDSNSMLARGERALRANLNDVERVVGPTDLLNRGADVEDIERHLVDNHFASLHQLVDGQGGAAQIDRVLALFNDLYMGLDQVQNAIETRSHSEPPTELLGRVGAEAAYLPEMVGGMVSALVERSERFAEGNVQRSLAADIEAEVGQYCRTALGGRYPFTRTASSDVTRADFQNLFGPGGRFDRFFRERLAQHTNTAGRVWVMQQASGNVVPLAPFQQAALLRDAFYPAGGGEMDLSFEVRVLTLDSRVQRLSMDFGGQQHVYQHGPDDRLRVRWPSQSNDTIRFVLQGGFGERVLSFNGPWSLFRLFDAGKLRAGDSAERFSASLNIEGLQVELGITANSVRNPFLLQQVLGFHCPTPLR
jgi:type VI secretion system protein ImpL